MVTTGAKYFFGVTLFGMVATLVYGWGSGGGMLGVLTLGLRGGVGELTGFTVLVCLAVTAVFLGGVTTAFRDADAEAVSQVAHTDEVPAIARPASDSYWPVVAAFAVTITLVGLVVGVGLVILGLILLGVTIVEWMVKAWADRATGDPEVNQSIRDRVMHPIEIPLMVAAGIAVLVFSVSRLLLTVPEHASVAVAGTFAVLVLAGAFLVAYRPTLGRSAVAALLLIGGLAVITAGVIGASVGERDFEKHGEQPTQSEGSLAPMTWHGLDA